MNCSSGMQEMSIGDVRHKVLPDGNVTTFYRSEVGMCAFTSFEPKSSAQMKQKREQLSITLN